MNSFLRTQCIVLCSHGVVCCHCSVIVLINKLSSILCVCGGCGGAGDRLLMDALGHETGCNLGTPFLSLSQEKPVRFLGRSLGRHPVNPYSGGECLGGRSLRSARLSMTTAMAAPLSAA